MPLKKLMEYLDNQKVKYVVHKHSPAYTAQEIASSAHIKGRELAKTVMIKVDEAIAMAVLPASFKVDLALLREALGAGKVELASEREFRDLFPDCQTGAMPPFGNLFGMEVFVDPSLSEDESIAFSAGSHTELVQLAYRDFEELVRPRLVNFSSSR
mgnify:CR=1 FL=1